MTGLRTVGQSTLRIANETGRYMPDLYAINLHLQQRLEREWREEVRAVEAARWLDKTGLLRDCKSGFCRTGIPPAGPRCWVSVSTYISTSSLPELCLAQGIMPLTETHVFQPFDKIPNIFLNIGRAAVTLKSSCCASARSSKPGPEGVWTPTRPVWRRYAIPTARSLHAGRDPRRACVPLRGRKPPSMVWHPD